MVGVGLSFPGLFHPLHLPLVLLPHGVALKAAVAVLKVMSVAVEFLGGGGAVSNAGVAVMKVMNEVSVPGECWVPCKDRPRVCNDFIC